MNFDTILGQLSDNGYDTTHQDDTILISKDDKEFIVNINPHQSKLGFELVLWKAVQGENGDLLEKFQASHTDDVGAMILDKLSKYGGGQ